MTTSSTESGLVTILFTDLVGSTELLSRAGDEEAQRIFRAHHDLLSETAASHGGQEVELAGGRAHGRSSAGTPRPRLTPGCAGAGTRPSPGGRRGPWPAQRPPWSG